MLIYSYAADLDEIDIVILQELQRNGRISNVELAQKINLSPPATHTRVKRLAEQGYIREFVALLDQELEGDGVDEVLITAERLNGLGNGLPTAVGFNARHFKWRAARLLPATHF